jgi:nucleotide-binding universal stress UspA family protein
MKKILFPTDFSESAHNAFSYTLRIADKWGASITVLHVFQKPEIRSLYVPKALEDFYKSYDLQQFANFKDKIPVLNNLAEEKGYGHISINYALKEGDNEVDLIISFAESEGFDQIIMGTTGAGFLKEVFLGSIAGEVLENASCPVLAVPAEAQFDGKIDHMAFASDFSDYSLQQLPHAISFAHTFLAKLHVLNVDTSHTAEFSQKVAKIKEDYLKEPNLTIEILSGNDISETLSNYLQQNSIDFLLMATHKRNWLAEMFQYSRTKNMAVHSKVPVMAFK